MLNCQQVTTRILIIKTKKSELANLVGDQNYAAAKSLQGEIQFMIDSLYFELLERKFRIGKVVTTGKFGRELATKLDDQAVSIDSGNAANPRSMLQSPEFVKHKSGEIIYTIKLEIRELFSDYENHSYAEIMTRAALFDLSALPHETGPDLLLREDAQALNENIVVMTKPISDEDGTPRIFRLDMLPPNRLWLGAAWATSDSKLLSYQTVMFRLDHISPKNNKLLKIQKNV